MQELLCSLCSQFACTVSNCARYTFITASHRRLILYSFMAPHRRLARTHSTPSLSSLRSFPISSSPIQEHLIPKPLTTRSSQVRLLPSQEDHVSAEVQDAREYSQTVVKSYSLGVVPCNQKGYEEKKVFYKCTLCRFPISPKSRRYTLPGNHSSSNGTKVEGSGRIFCRDCWIWIYDLSICWTCGEIVGRQEERIGFGWCWWHWGCLGCLICKVWTISLAHVRKTSN